MTPKTEYSTVNALFSDAAHEAAERDIYPAIFGVSQEHLLFHDVTNTAWDFDFGIDWVVSVRCDRRMVE